MNRVGLAAMIIAGTVTMAGCFSDRKYQEALSEAEAAKTELATTRAQKSALEQQVKTLKDLNVKFGNEAQAARDELERIEFDDDRLSRLKADLFDLGASIADLPRQSLVEMLTARGHGETIAQLNAPDVFVHARFAHPEASTDEAAQGWRAYFRGLYLRRLRSELEAARSTWVAEPNEENLHRIEELGRMLAVESEQAAQNDLSEVPAA